MLIHTHGAWWTRAIPHHEISPCFRRQEKFTGRGLLAPLNDARRIRESACYSINRIRQHTAEAEKRKSLFFLLFLSPSLVYRVSLMKPGRRWRRERIEKVEEMAKKKNSCSEDHDIEKVVRIDACTMVITLVTCFPHLTISLRGFVERERERMRERKK